jgi:hypothetical protein
MVITLETKLCFRTDQPLVQAIVFGRLIFDRLVISPWLSQGQMDFVLPSICTEINVDGLRLEWPDSK